MCRWIPGAGDLSAVGSAFYRFRERRRPALHQSESSPVLRYIRPDLLTGLDRSPPRLRPARPSGPGAWPWSRGAAGPGAGRPDSGRCPPAPRRPARRGRGRGARAGRRVERRRHRTDTMMTTGGSRPEPVLITPSRLTLRQTHSITRRDSAAGAGDRAAGH